MASPVVARATRAAPCPVCGSPSKGCSRTEDGLHLCRGEARQGWRRVSRGPDAAGFEHYRREDDPGPERNGNHKSEPTPPPKNWKSEAEQYAKRLTPELRAFLAGKLGLPVDALDAIPLLGYLGEIKPGTFEGDDELPTGHCWTFPEFDAFGRCTGINRRFSNNRKKVLFGHSRGLTLPEGWRERPGPLLIVEGASDVLALTACGIACVGKPSNTGGAAHLADLLRTLPTEKSIVVVGEWDERPSKDDPEKTIWPGRDGVISTKQELGRRLKRKILGAFPGNGLKDCRAWILDAIAGAGEELDLAAIGREFLAALEFDTPPEPEKPARGRDWSKLFITSDVFAARDTRANWLVKQVLVCDQPAVIGGPQKVLKTSFLVDLVISLASGTPFLGRFETIGKVKCAMLSGESGDDTLKRTAERVSESKGFRFADVADGVVWCFEVPALADPDDLGSLVDYLAAQKVKVAVVDPLYLALLAAGKDGPDAKNLYDMGPTFRAVATQFKAAGITPILAHHANRRGEPNKPMELSDLAFSGIAEFARQWLLLSRRKKYEGDGRHELWVNVGGSAGQSGLYVADINEGKMADDFSGRVWEVEVRTATEARSDSEGDSETRKANAKRELEMKDDREVLTAVDTLATATVSAIRGRVPRLTTTKIGQALTRLMSMGIVEPFEIEKAGGNKSSQSVQGYRRVKRLDEP